jgi:hypothetical protein
MARAAWSIHIIRTLGIHLADRGIVTAVAARGAICAVEDAIPTSLARFGRYHTAYSFGSVPGCNDTSDCDRIEKIGTAIAKQFGIVLLFHLRFGKN